MTRSGHQLNTDFGGAFGESPQYMRGAPGTTSSAVFATFASIVTPVLPAGTYRFASVIDYSTSNSSTVGEQRMRVDATDLDIDVLETASANEDKTYTDFVHAALAAGSHTITLDIRRSAGVGVFSVSHASLEIWRVS